MNAIDEMVRLFKRLPGMGEKSATRLCYYLLKADSSFVESLGNGILSLKRRITLCPVCGAFIDESGCPYCDDEGRDKGTICVVEEPQDVMTITQAGIYNGLFHVLVIIATNPTEEGDTTALYIRSMLKDVPGLKISRLASGLPIGGDLGYADKTTLIRSMRGRIDYSPSVPDKEN